MESLKSEVGPVYDASEQGQAIQIFTEMLWTVTRDGGAKRARYEKPPWWSDESHKDALYSHLFKWVHGDKLDADSGAHPLVHLAWRALALAYQETHGKVEPK